MRTLITILATVVVLMLLAAGAGALYVRSGAFDVAATAEHGPLTGALLRAVRRHAVAQGARGVEARIPEPPAGNALVAAALAYEDMCAACHTPPGRNATVLARGLNPEPPDLVRAAERRAPEQLFWVTKNGIRMTGMPAWGATHTDEDLWQIVAFVRSLPTMSGEEYERLLAAARAAGIEHRHGDEQPDPGDHAHDDHRH